MRRGLVALGPVRDSPLNIGRTLSLYLGSQRRLAGQLRLGTVLAAILMIATPFMTQSLVDQGVQQGDRDFVTMFLLAPGCLIVGSAAISLMRNWVLLYLSSRIIVALVADFLQATMTTALQDRRGDS